MFSRFRTTQGGNDFPVKLGRFHLFVVLNCPKGPNLWVFNPTILPP